MPWWASLSAAMAPVFLVGGWTLAAALQPAGYNSVRDTISAPGPGGQSGLVGGYAGIGGGGYGDEHRAEPDPRNRGAASHQFPNYSVAAACT